MLNSIPMMTVMAAELVRAARAESEGEPERLRLTTLQPFFIAGILTRKKKKSDDDY